MKAFFKYLFIILILTNALVAVPTIRLEVSDISPTKEADGSMAYHVTPQESFSITVTIQDNPQNAEEVQLQGSDQLRIVGRSQSTSMQIINGSVSSNHTTHYQVVAPQQGTFVIGPAILKYDNNVKESEKIKIIADRTAKTKQTSARVQQQAGYDVRCKIFASKNNVFVGEPVLLTVSIFVAGAVGNISWQQPKIAQCIVKEIQKETIKDDVVDNRPGKRIEKTMVLYPLQAGPLVMEPFVVAFAVPIARQRRGGGFGFFDDDFFSSFVGQRHEEKHVTSNQLTLSVSAVPQLSQPIEGVGHFTNLKATIDKTNAYVHDPLLFTLIIEGKGNFEQLTTPKLELPESMRSYESKSEIKEDFTTQYMGGRKKIEYVVQCTEAGKLVIPSQMISFFDTESKSVKQLKTEPIELTINPRKGTVTQKIAPAILGKDLEKEENQKDPMDAKKSFLLEQTHQANQPRALDWWIFILLALTPLLVLMIKNRRRILFLISHIVAKVRPVKKLSCLETDLKKIERLEKYEQLHQFFISVLAIKFTEAADVITENTIEQMLEHKGWDKEKITAFLDFMTLCAQLHFSGKYATVETKSLMKKAQYWFLMLKQ